MARITNLYFGYSTIPGNFVSPVFIPDINGLQLDRINYQSSLTNNIEATADALSNSIFGTNNVPTTNTNTPTPSDTLINYMGKVQQNALFTSLKYNIYRPDYSRVQLQPNVENVTPFIMWVLKVMNQDK